MKNLLLIITIMFNFNAVAEICYGSPVVRGNEAFCYEPLPENYAEFHEIKFSFLEGPKFPGWNKGIISILREAMDEFLDQNLEKAEELIKEAYAQNVFIIDMEKKWAKRRLLEKANPFMADAIIHTRSSRPRKRKFRNLLNKAIHNIERYTLKD